MHPIIGRVLIAVGLTLLASVSAGAAGPDNSEDICTTAAVFLCDNFEARPANVTVASQYLVTTYKNIGWEPSAEVLRPLALG